MRIRVILAALALVVLGAARSEALPIGIGTSPQGTLTYTLGSAYAKVLADAAKIQARVQPSSGTGVMIPLVETGELDMGFCNTLELNDAYTGSRSFAGRPQPHLRTLGVLFPIRVGIFVRDDSPIKSMADLKGKSIAYGYTSQEVIKTVIDGLLANAGLSISDMRPVLVPNLVRGVDDFVAGRVDAVFFAMGQAKVSEADAAVGGIRFLPISDSQTAVEAMRKFVPTAYVASVDPAPNLPGVKTPLAVMNYDYVMFANSNLKDERVKELTAIMAEKKDDLAKIMPLFRQFDPTRMYRDIGVPYHDGAKAFFEAKGIKPVD